MRGIVALRLALWAAVAVLAGFVAVVAFRDGSIVPAAALAPGTAIGQPFSLVDQNGKPVTDALLRGRPTALFFGFTHCPEVCPTTLAELAGHLDALGEAGERIAVVFVTVDPERDTPDILKGYVEGVSPRFTALTGEPAAIEAVRKSFGIHARKVPLDGGDYTMDHTASVLLLDSEGKLVATLAYGEDEGVTRQKLQRLASL